MLKKDCSWNPRACLCENSKSLKSIADTSVIEDDEVIIVLDIVSTKKRQIPQQQMLRVLLQ